LPARDSGGYLINGFSSYYFYFLIGSYGIGGTGPGVNGSGSLPSKFLGPGKADSDNESIKD